MMIHKIQTRTLSSIDVNETIKNLSSASLAWGQILSSRIICQSQRILAYCFFRNVNTNFANFVRFSKKNGRTKI